MFKSIFLHTLNCTKRVERLHFLKYLSRLIEFHFYSHIFNCLAKILLNGGPYFLVLLLLILCPPLFMCDPQYLCVSFCFQWMVLKIPNTFCGFVCANAFSYAVICGQSFIVSLVLFLNLHIFFLFVSAVQGHENFAYCLSCSHPVLSLVAEVWWSGVICNVD